MIFCATDSHADIVVQQLRQALAELYGSIDDNAVEKITGKADQPLQLIRRFRNEVNPKIAVTVDLLTTGIDVPAICNLVFIRRVNSRILYEQMLGRATRRCDDINKEVFRIFDAVDLYAAIAPVSSMKPVAVDPNLSFAQLVNELDTVQTPAAVESILDQLLAKLQRKRRHLSETQRSQLEAIAGVPTSDLVSYLKQQKPDELRAWFEQRKTIGEILDRKDGGIKPILISHHADELRRIERGYGSAERPQDYLESFRQRWEMRCCLIVSESIERYGRFLPVGLGLHRNDAGWSELGSN